jgi:hypothetical protein
MRSRIAVVALSAAFSVALTSVPARATDCSGVLSPCINDDALWPHAGPARFIAVGSTETVASGHIGFGLVTSYLSRPVVLHLASPGVSQGSDRNVVDDQVNGTFLWAYGATRRLELDIALPVTFGQSGTGLAPVTGGPGLRDTAVRDMRFGFSYAIVPHLPIAPDGRGGPTGARLRSWGLLARLEVSAPTGDEAEFAGERSGVFVPSAAGDLRVGQFTLGAEFGARIRPTTELLGARIDTQFVAAVGFGFDVLPRELLGVALEAWALPTLIDQATSGIVGAAYAAEPNGKYIVPAEWQLSVRSAPLRGGDFSIQAGGGTAIPLSGGDLPITAPRFRFNLGLRWSPR